MTAVNWETVAATLAGILLLILLGRALVLLHLWVWHNHLKWPWQKRRETLQDHISYYNVERGLRSGRMHLTDEDLAEIEHLRRALAYHDERKRSGQHGTGGPAGKHSGSTGFSAGTNYE